MKTIKNIIIATIFACIALECVICINRPCYSQRPVSKIVLSIITRVLEPNLVFETEYWKVYLAEDQRYIGRCIIYFKKPRANITELTLEEREDWFSMISVVESAIQQAFDARLFNLENLQNYAHKVKPYTPQVHWHLIPRYDHPVVFEGHKFEDKKFGRRHTGAGKKIILDKKTRKAIIKEIRKHLAPLQ